jgi:hypothetical protein
MKLNQKCKTLPRREERPMVIFNLGRSAVKGRKHHVHE